ncbi:MAG: hypothetical protein JXA10_03980 [Anaerolineae bacterium]|nr:hypothetical protein [Anaerolineae bacterium]
MHSILVHVANEEPVLAEVEELPSTTDQAVYCINPRKRDGKELHYVLTEVQTIIIPWHRINFIEIMPSGDDEEIISPFAD